MKLIALILILNVPALAANGQSVKDLFHDGAQYYIAGEKPQALAAVNAGLEAAPEDARLIALKQLIEEQEDEEEQSDDQSQENEDGQDQEEPEGDSDEQQEDEQEPSDEGEESQDAEKQDAPGADEQKPSGEPEQPDEPSGQPPPVNPEELTQEQAEAILQALEQDEEKLLRQVQKMKTAPRRVEKDW